jgi:TRAP-type C4-dicarboxylate transport system substrate-binding protein
MKPDLRDGVLKAVTEASTDWNTRAGGIEGAATEELKGRGVTVETCDRAAFRERVQPLWEQFTQRTPGAKALLDAARATAKA